MLNKLIMTSCLLVTTFVAHAQMIAPRYIIAPTCLLRQAKINYHTLSSANQMSLVEMDADSAYILREKSSRVKSCGNFKDMTVDWQRKSATLSAQTFLTSNITQISALAKKTATQSTYQIRYTKQANQLIPQINPANIWNKLATLTTFPDRYAGDNFAGSANGVKTANWIKSQLEAMALESHRNDITIFTIDTQYNYKPGTILKQPSVIIKIGNSPEAGIVLGAHMDTMSSKYELKPGADDDGSGSAAMLETARVILSSGMTFKRPIYFMWYAAEELGLLGSQSVVTEFEKQHIPVAQALQFDAIGYTYQNDLTMWLLNDASDTDTHLTQYVETLITHYVKRPVKYTACGYSCSDHASWMHRGFSAASVAATSFENKNTTWHSANDTMDKLSLEHITDFTKLAVAATVELAEPNS